MSSTSLMSSEEIIFTALDLLKEYGESAKNEFFGRHSDWTVRITTDIKKSIMGTCDIANRDIAISEWYAKNISRLSLIDVIKHEVAHSLAGFEYARNGNIIVHGKTWKMFAAELGCSTSAKSCRSTIEFVTEYCHLLPYKYVLIYINPEDDSVTEHGGLDVVPSLLCHREVNDDLGTFGNLWLMDTKRYLELVGHPANVIRTFAFR